MVTLPALDGVEHKFVDVGGDVTIHVADSGPAGGPAVMLVHGFPQNWWEWHALIGPLADDGYRVLCPDLRGAGWSSAPRSRYRKDEMADDLAVVLDRLAAGPVKLVAHDWGGPAAFIMMLRYPAKVTGFFGLNTVAPWPNRDFAMLGHAWRLWYQIPMALPVIGPRVISDPKARFFRMLLSWVGGGFSVPEDDFWMYVELMREPGHAVAGSRWYRTALTSETPSWLRGEYDDARVDVPVRWLHGTDDPVITPLLLRGYDQRATDFELELVDGVGHWIVEQRPELVLDRVRKFLRT
ncbi:MAG: alpha/beta fold hydrolase [Mycobacterium sp.]|nr:alpha/beta fold hydrolase [Mycobacterium sp.]